MIKTESEIERDFFALAKESQLGKAIGGNVYRSEMRPDDAATEDMVVKFLAGIDEQVQSGIVILNVYVPDITHGGHGRKVADKARIAQLQRLVLDFIQGEGGTEYLLRADTTPTTIAVDDIGQHAICARVHFQRITI